MKKLQFLLIAATALFVFAACEKTGDSKGSGNYGSYPGLIVGTWRLDNNEIILDASEELEDIIFGVLELDPDDMAFMDNGDTFVLREDGTSWDGETEVKYTVSGRTLKVEYPDEYDVVDVLDFDIQLLNKTTLVLYQNTKAMMIEYMEDVAEFYGVSESDIEDYVSSIKKCGLKLNFTRVE